MSAALLIASCPTEAPGESGAAAAPPSSAYDDGTTIDPEDEDADDADEVSDEEEGEDGNKFYWDNVVKEDDENYLGEDVFLVESIVDRRKIDGVTEYLIKWKGWPSSDNTWEPEENVTQELVAEFELTRKNRKQPSFVRGMRPKARPNPVPAKPRAAEVPKAVPKLMKPVKRAVLSDDESDDADAVISESDDEVDGSDDDAGVGGRNRSSKEWPSVPARTAVPLPSKPLNHKEILSKPPASEPSAFKPSASTPMPSKQAPSKPKPVLAAAPTAPARLKPSPEDEWKRRRGRPLGAKAKPKPEPRDEREVKKVAKVSPATGADDGGALPMPAHRKAISDRGESVRPKSYPGYTPHKKLSAASGAAESNAAPPPPADAIFEPIALGRTKAKGGMLNKGSMAARKAPSASGATSQAAEARRARMESMNRSKPQGAALDDEYADRRESRGKRPRAASTSGEEDESDEDETEEMPTAKELRMGGFDRLPRGSSSRNTCSGGGSSASGRHKQPSGADMSAPYRIRRKVDAEVAAPKAASPLAGKYPPASSAPLSSVAFGGGGDGGAVGGSPFHAPGGWMGGDERRAAERRGVAGGQTAGVGSDASAARSPDAPACDGGVRGWGGRHRAESCSPAGLASCNSAEMLRPREAVASSVGGAGACGGGACGAAQGEQGMKCLESMLALFKSQSSSSASGNMMGIGGSATMGGSAAMGGSIMNGSTLQGGSNLMGAGGNMMGGKNMMGGTSILGGNTMQGGSSMMGGGNMLGGNKMMMPGNNLMGGNSMMGGNNAMGGNALMGGHGLMGTNALMGANNTMAMNPVMGANAMGANRMGGSNSTGRAMGHAAGGFGASPGMMARGDGHSMGVADCESAAFNNCGNAPWGGNCRTWGMGAGMGGKHGDCGGYRGVNAAVDFGGSGLSNSNGCNGSRGAVGTAGSGQEYSNANFACSSGMQWSGSDGSWGMGMGGRRGSCGGHGSCGGPGGDFGTRL
ncbi:hypothetical protein AB1Y20_007129 [Prymnesium parvum]|uniref:Chromo domain-containing protein n=1 Tax=Prymnesium parvum TaxID=97485 RepID=A0AB34J3N3_PRYPA